MQIGDWAATPDLNDIYREIRDLGLETNLAELEAFGTKEAMADDQKVADVYAKKNATIVDLDEKTVDQWREIARGTAWKDYAGRSTQSAEFIKLAEGIHVS